MQVRRRDILKSALAAGAAAALPLSAQGSTCYAAGSNPNYPRLDEIVKEPVFKKELFPNPVIIDTLELLHYKDSYLCRVRSKDGAEGLSVGNTFQLDSLYPFFVRRLQPFFIERTLVILSTFWRRLPSIRATTN